MDEKILKTIEIENQKKLIEKIGTVADELAKEKPKVEIVNNILTNAEVEESNKTLIIKGIKGDKGEDGITPTKEELVSLIKPLIPEPIKGDKGEDGKNGIDGKTPTEDELLGIIIPLIPEPIKGQDGKDGVNGKDGSPDTPEQIIEKLEKVEYFDKSVEKKKLINEENLNRAIEILDKRTQFLINKATPTSSTANNLGAFGVTVDGQSGVISTGQKGYLSIPYSGTITGWVILADQAGSCVIDTWKDTYGNFPPTVADTIWGGSKPTLSSAQKNTATGLSIAVTAGDIFAFNVDSATLITRVNLIINITKS